MIALAIGRLQRERHEGSWEQQLTGSNTLTEVLTSLDRAANALSTVRYMTADPATALAVAADSRAQALLRILADHLAAIGPDSQ